MWQKMTYDPDSTKYSSIQIELFNPISDWKYFCNSHLFNFQAEWEAKKFRDCNGVSNGASLSRTTLRFGAIEVMVWYKSEDIL